MKVKELGIQVVNIENTIWTDIEPGSTWKCDICEIKLKRGDAVLNYPICCCSDEVICRECSLMLFERFKKKFRKKQEAH